MVNDKIIRLRSSLVLLLGTWSRRHMNQDTDRSFAVYLIRRDVDGASTAIIFRDEAHAALFDIGCALK